MQKRIKYFLSWNSVSFGFVEKNVDFGAMVPTGLLTDQTINVLVSIGKSFPAGSTTGI